MQAVLLDFNGTMIFDSSLHLEAWSKIYQELHPDSTEPASAKQFCGPRNHAILKNIAPWLTDAECDQYSARKEAMYRQACVDEPGRVSLVAGLEDFLNMLQQRGIPFGLASASIKDNIDFFYETYALGRWFRKEDIVYDDGTYADKGAMHLEAARRLNTAFSDCLIIEDSPSSIRHARENGAGCIVAITGDSGGSAESCPGADHYIRDFTEFDQNWL